MNEFFKKPVVKILMLKGEKGDKGNTGEGFPKGGKTGQYLQKKSNADYDFAWSPITTVSWENVSGKTEATTTTAGLMSAEDKAKLDDLKVGGRNLLLNSDVEITNNAFNIANYFVSPSEGEPLSNGYGYLVEGKEYVVTACVTPGEHVEKIGVYVAMGGTAQTYISVNGTEKQIISGEFTAHYGKGTPSVDPGNAIVRIYRFPNDSGVTYGNTTIHWIRIEPWVPTQKDIDSDIAKLNSITKSFTLSASSWSDGSYTISDALITATSNQEILPALNITADQMKALQKANIIDSGQSAGSLTLKALGTVPTIDIPIRVIFRGTI